MNFSVKVITSIAILVALIVGISIVTQNILYKTAGDLEEYITKAENSAKSGEWSAALQSVQQIQNKWSKIKGIWAILIDHQEIDNIDVTLARMQKFIQCRDTSSALAEASALLKFIGHIPKKETLLLENIL